MVCALKQGPTPSKACNCRPLVLRPKRGVRVIVEQQDTRYRQPVGHAGRGTRAGQENRQRGAEIVSQSFHSDAPHTSVSVRKFFGRSQRVRTRSPHPVPQLFGEVLAIAELPCQFDAVVLVASLGFDQRIHMAVGIGHVRHIPFADFMVEADPLR